MLDQRLPDALDVTLTPPAVEARGLSFTVGGTPLIDQLDLALPRDRLTVILGPNGAGKSLLLRLLHGLAQPTGGAVYAEGRPLDRDARRAQALVFQRPVLLRRSAAANLDFALKTRGVVRAERRRRIAALLADVELSDLADRPARALSGGQQQRLALARALATEPRILFLDEPTASLDPAAADAIERLVRRIHARGVAIAFVTHDLGQARRLADEVVFLHRGAVVERAGAARFFAGPASEPARAYLDGRLPL